MRRFLAVLRSFFHSSLLCTFSCHPSPPTILPSSLTSSCHLILGLPLNIVVPKFIYNTSLGILFSSILCPCPNQRNLFNLIVYIIQCVPLSTEPGISLIIVTPVKMLQRNLHRGTFIVWEMKKNVSVVRFKFRCDILISGKIIKEMPGSVASGTHCSRFFLSPA